MTEALAFVAGALVVAATTWILSSRVRRPPQPASGGGSRGADVEGERRRTAGILERMSDGVVVLDERLRPVFANAPARALLGLADAALPSRLPGEDLAMLAWRSVREGRALEQVLELWYPARTSLRTHAAPLDGSAGVVVVVHDVTHELETQRLRREFVAHASHELKSPVAGLQVLADAIRGAVRDDPAAAAGFAERMAHEADRLGHLVGDLLDLSRLEEAERVPEVPVDLSAVVDAEVVSATYAAERDGTTLRGDVEPGVWVRGEKAQLGNLTRNLLDNAVRYTPDGGSIRVTLHRDGPDAVLTVTDDGIGIPLDEQGRVFERFYRVDRARSRDTGGTGLGLAIVKHIAELHGGSVAVESEVGRGSTFRARLPAIAGTQNVRSIAG